MSVYDVVIAGAGPGGCAAALSLKSHAPQLRVALVDPARETGSVIGEAASPHLRPMLEQLGLWQAFQAEGHRPVYRSQSSWGSPDLGGVEFLEFPLAQGWTLDRAPFNRFLLTAAERGVDARLFSGINHITRRSDELWQLGLSGGAPGVKAKVVIDATGRAAGICRMLGGRATRHDRLIGYYASTPSLPETEAGVMLETRPEGWWYSAEIPGKRRILAFLTDSDLGRKGAGLGAEWLSDMLAQTRHIRHLIPNGAPIDATPHPAASQQMQADLPDTILPVGDAAACFDPIAASGIVKALRGGIFASYAIADHLVKGDAQALGKYHNYLRREWDSYLASWHKYYGQERQFADSPFWARRQPVAALPPHAPLSGRATYPKPASSI